ncbi:nose resistant to fluoxetine protein 6-like [Physella acuta]|uniref:nose resistant to fluoxetine protein 6-like n=1 Tax=Physella acuta TaxID=109671 RepID=UPI0027DBF901|nr:nose resistant to fluoxetine protein 6-like [Physella acuta]
MRYGMKPNTACPDHWWANLLFISNFYKADSMCMPWTYYLVNDLQFSLLAPLVAIPLLCYPVIGFLLVVLLIGVQITSVMVINTGINGSILRMSNTDYFSKVYVKPYCRVGAYAIGLGLGYLLYTGDKKIRLRQIPLYVGWVVCLAVVAILPYITYMENQVGGDRWSGIETSLYEAISRPSWALAVAWVIFTCCNGQGGFISKILSWNFFIPLCRITYGVFLIHPILIEVSLNSGYSNQYVTFGQMTYGYIANFVSCWCLALMFIVIIEQPFTSIEALVRTHLTSKKTR